MASDECESSSDTVIDLAEGNLNPQFMPLNPQQFIHLKPAIHTL